MSPLARLAVLLIRAYQRFWSPYTTPRCRFVPSCSEYGARAFSLHGFFRGLALTARRILRCHPFARGGYDPVPGDPPADASQGGPSAAQAARRDTPDASGG